MNTPQEQQSTPTTSQKLMTERECLELCLQMWRWIHQQYVNDFAGRASKVSFLEAHPEYPQELEYDCACCTFVTQRHPDKCDDGMPCAKQYSPGDIDAPDTPFISPSAMGCPLAAVWPHGCCHKSSPFQDRLMRTAEHAAQQTQKIVDACEARLKELQAQEAPQ